MEVMLKVWEWMEWPRKWTWSVEGRTEGETPGTSQPRDSHGEGGASWSLREEKGASWSQDFREQRVTRRVGGGKITISFV